MFGIWNLEKVSACAKGMNLAADFRAKKEVAARVTSHKLIVFTNVVGVDRI